MPFEFRLAGVVYLAGKGKLHDARRRLAPLRAPDGYDCIKEAYDARLASLSYVANVIFDGAEHNPPDEMLSLISSLQSHRWYLAPSTNNERYSARYLDYLEAFVLGNFEKGELLAGQLKEAPLDKFLRDVLFVS